MKCFAFIVFIMLSGCASVKDISNNEPLPLDLKLGVVTLNQDVCLFSKSADFIEQETDSWLLVNTLGAEGCAGSNLLIRIPTGEAVELLKLVEHTSYGLFIFTRWYVIGQHESSGTKVTFYYELPWFRRNDGNMYEYDTVFLANGI